MSEITGMLRAGLEAIDFQKDKKLGIAIEKELRIIRASKKEIKASSLNGIVDAIKTITGISVNFELTFGGNAYVYPRKLTKNNVLINHFPGWLQDSSQSIEVINRKDFIKGGVDLKKGIVTGDFRDITCMVGVGTSHLTSNSEFTLAETTAIILHELGHIFCYFELLYRNTTTNYLLTDLTERVLNINSSEERVKILRDYRKAGFNIKDPEEVAKVESKEAAVVLVAQAEYEECRSSLGENIYDTRGYEALADNFAIRMGYGKALGTGLAKLLDYTPERSRGIRWFVNVLEVTLFLPANLLAAPLILIFDDGKDLYDSHKTRANVIRQQMSKSLKNEGLPKEEVRRILDDIDELEKVWEKSVEWEPLGRVIWKLAPWNRKKLKLAQIQKQLEKVGNNRLHELAARLEA